jgi:radical SAM superfamily enzyme YgiQ (UPF0313 family)
MVLPLELLKRTGCFYVYLGIETGSARMQKIIKKNLLFKTVFAAIRNIQEYGISVNANIMYGFPEETLEDLHTTLDLINTLRYIGVHVNISLLGPELKTAVSEAAPLTDYLFNASSRYVSELTQCGFTPEDYREIYLNHLYTLKNRHYDILLYNGFIQFWHALVSDYPMTVNAFTQPFGVDWNRLVALWNDQIKSKALTGISIDAIPDLLKLFYGEPGQNAKEAEITLIEHHLAMRSQKPASPCRDLPGEQLREYYRHFGKIRNTILAEPGMR